MSADERPEFRALADLEETVHAVADELAAWRRRAHRAENHQQEWEKSGALVGERERILSLEQENGDLKARLSQARDRMEELVARLKFLEDQAAAERAEQ
ncbi:MAG: hypothetical protein OEZ54_06800 [Gemmatimonadota bacterium]|nr:hypothetical protein [Gemmatimonadota bacterium]